MALARQGADVVVASRNPSHLTDTVAQIEALGRKGLAIPKDVRDVSQIYRMVEETIKVFGQIDILVTKPMAH